MSKLVALLGHWSAPPDGVARGAVIVAALLVAAALLPGSRARALLERAPRAVVVIVLAFLAGFLSLGYVVVYLHGGPRIIDATMYFLQGRALSHGAFSWPLGDPSEAVRGRFLYAHAGRIGGIFPPGYPLILALGFRLGAPLAIGPFTAIALVLMTYLLARSLARELAEREAIARTAALLSVVCAALRYHTADTMAHGVSALEITIALFLASEAWRALTTARSPADGRTGRLLLVGAGLALGLLAATRPVSAIGATVAIVVLAWSAQDTVRARLRSVVALALALLPGLALLLGAQHAVTGQWLQSTQRAYYATSDGPPGCFRYGFGAGIGCLGEHGDYVKDRLPHGYTPLAALLVTLRRLHLHLRDVLSFEPLALLVLVPFVPFARRRVAGVRRFGPIQAAGLLLLVHVLAYAPFYFDGDYPGGGARFFADLLPVEHVLAALGLALLVARSRAHRSYPRFALGLVAVSLFAFGVHAVHDHRELAARDGGSPMFETHKVQGSGAEHGLVYFDTDHGFDLAYDPQEDPAVKGASKESEALAPRDPDAPAPLSLRAVRRRGDDGDRLVFDKAGHPPSFRYLFDPQGAPAEAKVEAWTPGRVGPRDSWRFEAESSWPPLAQHQAWAETVWLEGVSGGRVLVVTGVGVGAEIVADVPIPGSDAVWTFTPRIVMRGIQGHAELVIGTAPDVATWTWDDSPTATLGSRDLATQNVPAFGQAALPVHLKVTGQVAWDRTLVRAR